MSEPVLEDHNDVFDIEVHFEAVTATLKEAGISLDGLFINADACLDTPRIKASLATYASTSVIEARMTILTKNCMMKDMPWNASTYGWTIFAQY